MLKRSLFLALSMVILTTLPAAAQQAQPQLLRQPVSFRITLSKDIASKTVSGRVIVLMTNSTQARDPLTVGFVPGSTWVAAKEVAAFLPGQTIELDPDIVAYPRRFSDAKPGTYQVMALLDPNHTYAYHGQDEGDLTSSVVKLENLNPADAKPVELTLTRVTAGRFQPENTDTVKLAELQSKLLSRFWGREIKVRAGIVLPPDYDKEKNKRYPAVYHIHGFGGDHTGAWRSGNQSLKDAFSGKYAEMIHVYLDGSFPTGHHEFADSVNNGPWGRALTEEFIPYLEKNFRLVARPYARFLTGHSSGGWSSLWLQVTYPDFFGGTWSTAPDPVDLRSFTGIDASVGSKDNAFREADGKAKILVRMNGKDFVSFEDFLHQEEVLGEYGGQLASFEWVWSPRGQDGRPVKMFNRETGELNQDVLKYWQNYDIRLILENNWQKLGPKLKGKINVFCGDADTFRLNEAVVMLCDMLKRKGSDAVCELVPGRDHGSLYQPYKTFPDGLTDRIYQEMSAKYKNAVKVK